MTYTEPDYRAEAAEQARRLVTDLHPDDPAGITQRHVVEVELSGGGPTAWLEAVYATREDYENGEYPDRLTFHYHYGQTTYRETYSPDEAVQLWDRLTGGYTD